jgi:ElaB/YqjD/DUF883 family membrane-anchored ribosome-binding protein
MPPETELVKQQMSQTRAALAEKLETLETKVLGTVHEATDSVAQTVHEVGSAARETAENVRAAMHEAVGSVRDALDVSRQVHQHPWLLMGGSVFAGYVGGRILDNLERGHLPSLPSMPVRPERFLPQGSELRERMESERPVARSSGPSFLKSLVETFAPELEKAKRAAVGMALGLVRDKLREAVPPQMRENVTEMMDRVAVKLGGEPTPPGAMLGQEDSYEEGDGARMAQAGGFG